MNLKQRSRRGIVLIIVLGMLSLFTVLVVSFVVFSSQMAQTSASSNERQRTEIPITEPITASITQVMSGTNDHFSALYGRSLFEDLYGTDGMQLRVAHRRARRTPLVSPFDEFPLVPATHATNVVRFGGLLLLPLRDVGVIGDSSDDVPNTTLFKFPTNFAPWNDDGDVTVPPGNETLTNIRQNTINTFHRPDLDDSFTGRVVTFDEGPLANVSFRVIRSFGRQNGEPPAARAANARTLTTDFLNPMDEALPSHPDYLNGSLYNADEYAMAGCLVIDLAELPTEEVIINGVPQPLYQVAAFTPNVLLYSPGPDGQPGIAGVDDDGVIGGGGTDDIRELGWPGSDDVGYRFTMNGVPFNGRGMNPSGITGIGRNGAPVDSFADLELQLNPRLMGPTIRPQNSSGLGLFPEPDEQWDVAGFDDVYLAWQPSDHRRTSTAVSGNVYNGFNSGEFNRQLGQHVIPSLHRPAIINYLMNAPIRIEGDSMDPTNAMSPPVPIYLERTFADMVAAPNFTAPFNDHLRLQALINRLRRAVLRPLNIDHIGWAGSAANNGTDLNGDGVPFDGAPGFSGSNAVPILNRTLNFNVNFTNTTEFLRVAEDVRQLAVWLINGPWDVDNDGDGLPDSLWTDLNLNETTAPDGTTIKPMVALLIEDLDGKINVNVHGNMGQALQPGFIDGPNNAGDRRYNNAAEYVAVRNALGSFGFGSGVGPADIDFSHLFAGDTVATGFNGPYPTNQLGAGSPSGFTRRLYLVDDTPQNRFSLLRTRYGNLLNVRHGAPVYDYFGNFPVVHFPGVGTTNTPLPNSDLLSRIPFEAREDEHGLFAFNGRPMDMMGLLSPKKDSRGELRYSEVQFPNDAGAINYESVLTDRRNHPYESGADEARGDDNPFSPVEFVDFLGDGSLNGRLAQLLGDAARLNPGLKNLLTTESRSLESPEFAGDTGFLQLLASKLDTASVPIVAQQFHLDRMVAPEFRKGSKLNLNRQLPETTTALISNLDGDGVTGESDERDTRLDPPLLTTANSPNNRVNGAVNGATVVSQSAFPQINATHPVASSAPSRNVTTTFAQGDFDGVDLDNDGTLDIGTQFDTDGDTVPDSLVKAPTSNELLARHLYVLMFTLIQDPSGAELVPNFPYPSPGNFPNDAPTRNRFVAHRLAQWAVNAVDFRDKNVARTRLRYDPNPFDGWDPNVATRFVVWGMERPELELTEAMAFHDKRLKRELMERGTQANEDPSDEDPDTDNDGDPTTGTLPDSDMDQFRIPQASAYVELHSLRTPTIAADINTGARQGETQQSLPRELYDTGTGRLDLGRFAGAAADPRRSPVWRLAVGAPNGGDMNLSTRWLFDANRVGRELVGNQGRTDELGYLQVNAPDWTMPADVDAAVDMLWDSSQRHTASIEHVPFSPTMPGVERVQLADDDFDPRTVSPSTVSLERFVWFANFAPTPGSLDILAANGSAMRPNNVYFNRLDRATPGDTGLPINASSQLEPGGYAVIAPRQTTVLGQTAASAAGALFEYSPVNQRFEFALQTPPPLPGQDLFRFNYHDLEATNPMTPRYLEDNAGAFHQTHVVPIICESLMPHETIAGPPVPGTNRAAWDNYLMTHVGNAGGLGVPVDMGFNISAPLPTENYYEAPTNNIKLSSAIPYPQVDGYRDYDNSTGLHPDVPFDHLPTAPMEANSYDVLDAGGNVVTVRWNAVGTHQEVRTIFLQRLADPTIPWHPVDNPYLTEDFIPIDLTTFNGEGDVREEVDRNADGDATNDNYFADQARTLFDGANFTPAVKMDSRRKIPAVQKDRVSTNLIRGSSTGTSHRRRITVRSPLSATMSVLRGRGPIAVGTLPANPYWPFEVGSEWDNDTHSDWVALDVDDPNPLAPSVVDPFDTRYSPSLNLDAVGTPFTQTFGFVNREYGFPVRSDETEKVNLFGTGQPDAVFLNTLTWFDREFQSPHDLLSVPAVSRTGLLSAFSPGTVIDGPTSGREIPTNYGHLLSFMNGFGQFRAADADWNSTGGPTRTDPNNDRLPLGTSQDIESQEFVDEIDLFAGDRPGFEQIFDYVDVGPVWFDSQRWLDPEKVLMRTDGNLATQNAVFQGMGPLFNRTVEFMQPPYNYISRHRVPGRINLNTMPDYVRKGPNFLSGSPVNDYFDAGEDPINPNNTPAFNRVDSNPQNNNINADGFSTEFLGSRLFANGSVYQSFAWGISTPYELDLTSRSPSVLGSNNEYMTSVDTRFGFGFKAFIESRRGYGNSQRASTNIGGVQQYADYQNAELDWRYPTRFAGVFGPARSAANAGVQRFMRTDDNNTHPTITHPHRPSVIGSVRRTHDMGIFRSHPDFSERLLTPVDRTNHATPGSGAFALSVENDPTSSLFNDAQEAWPTIRSCPPLLVHRFCRWKDCRCRC